MEQGQQVYIKEDDVNFRKQSDEPDDTRKTKRGQELVVVDGPWWRVATDGHQGWVRADYISEIRPLTLEPVKRTILFVKGQPHPASSDVTKRVREAINDALNGAKNGYSLQCTEYVQYRVKEKLDIEIKWPVLSGRHGGFWWKIFQDAGMYKIPLEPVIDCAMCLTVVRKKDGTLTEEGHIAFVEEVFPDNSVKISEANWPGDGIYNERVITKNDWQNKYKARFVEFT